MSECARLKPGSGPSLSSFALPAPAFFSTWSSMLPVCRHPVPPSRVLPDCSRTRWLHGHAVDAGCHSHSCKGSQDHGNASGEGRVRPLMCQDYQPRTDKPASPGDRACKGRCAAGHDPQSLGTICCDCSKCRHWPRFSCGLGSSSKRVYVSSGAPELTCWQASGGGQDQPVLRQPQPLDERSWLRRWASGRAR